MICARQWLTVGIFSIACLSVGCGRSRMATPALEHTEVSRPYRFSHNYSPGKLVGDAAARDEFVRQILFWEANFHGASIGYNEKSGLTYDGHHIDFRTGELIGGPRNWSAASKESLHIKILSLAIAGNACARLFVSPDDPDRAGDKAVRILERKITSYEKFNLEFPGFGNHLPWFLVADDGMQPTSDWQDRVPGLDNGQLAWALYLAYHVLRDTGHAGLSERYRSHFDLMARTSVMIFYDEETGKIRAEARIRNTKAEPTVGNYSNNTPGYFLDDAYEGELQAFFMTLFGEWSDNRAAQRVWQGKKMVRAEFKTPVGSVTVVQGHWYSAHEKWNLLVLPYMDVPLARKILVNGEKARTWFSAMKRVPGLLASTHEPVSGNRSPRYRSELGIAQLAKKRVEAPEVATPYAAFPVILTDLAVGLCWYDVMLDGPRMQGPYGSTESITVDGTRIAPLVTWDGKGTIILALLGGVSDQISDYLKSDGKYQRFYEIVTEEFTEAFQEPLDGEDVPFAMPTACLPWGMGDFEPPREGSIVDAIADAAFDGDGALSRSHRMRKDGLYLPKAEGFIWTRIRRVDLAENPVIVVEAETAGGGVFIEVKNTDDRLTTDGKIKVDFPDTAGEFRSFAINVSKLVVSKNKTAAILVFSDPDAVIGVKSLTFHQAIPEGCEPLTFDGRRFVRGGDTARRLREKEQAMLPFEDILSKTNFRRGGGVRLEHDTSLVLKSSRGWIWGFIRRTDLNETPILTMVVKTERKAGVWLELKDEEDTPLVGESRFGTKKVHLAFPNTDGKKMLVSLDLSAHLVKGIKDHTARIMALSDPTSTIEITGFGFSKERPRAAGLLETR